MHPSFEELLTALEAQDNNEIRKWSSRISADKWQGLLVRVKRPNTRLIYANLARVGGRSQMNITLGDWAPILHNGRLVTRQQERFEATAEHVCAKTTAPETHRSKAGAADEEQEEQTP